MVHLISCLVATAVAFSISQAAPVHYPRDVMYEEIDTIQENFGYQGPTYHYAPNNDIREPEVFQYFVRDSTNTNPLFAGWGGPVGGKTETPKTSDAVAGHQAMFSGWGGKTETPKTPEPAADPQPLFSGYGGNMEKPKSPEPQPLFSGYGAKMGSSQPAAASKSTSFRSYFSRPKKSATTDSASSGSPASSSKSWFSWGRSKSTKQ
jgi:hypothetical protein